MIRKFITGLLFLFSLSATQGQCFLVPTEVCLGECGPVFYLQNDPDGTTYQWSIDCGTITNETAANPHTVCFNQTGTCIIQVIINVPGEDPDTCTETVEVLPHSLTVVQDSVCTGDSIEINGTYYLPGFYTDTIFGGASNSCDSILLITITEAIPDTTDEIYFGCEGDGYEVIVNGTTYNEANPIGTEVMTGTNGCDSIININLTFNPHSTANFIYIGCVNDGFSIDVNGTIYNESNPSGVEVIVASNGCDSIIIIELTFLPPHQDTISYSGCTGDGFSVTVGSNVYDENNPSGVDTIIGGCDTIVTINLSFDTIIASLTLTGNQLCASPSGLNYTWMNCDSTLLPDTTECITLTGTGCVCVIVDNGICADTICQDYDVCELTCEVDAPEGSCLGDSVSINAISNASISAEYNWIITLDSFAPVQYNDQESLMLAFNTPGCYTIELTVVDLGCITTCVDTICVAEKPLADLCCDVVACDTCATLTVFLFGNGPLTIAISDGFNIDTISGITTSQYDYTTCPPYDTNVVYSLLWVSDTLGYCNGGLINDSVDVFVEQIPEASITFQGNTICADQDGFAYEWTDCQNSTILSINQCFNPPASGCYCVTLSTLLTDCIDTACVNFILTGTPSPENEEEIEVWYRSQENAIYIKHPHSLKENSKIYLYDVQGRTVPYGNVEHLDSDLLKVNLVQHIPSLLVVSLRDEYGSFTKGIFVPGE